jgi:hypothetical protein
VGERGTRPGWQSGALTQSVPTHHPLTQLAYNQVIEFTPEGKLIRVLRDIPGGARICNVAHASEHDMCVGLVC